MKNFVAACAALVIFVSTTVAEEKFDAAKLIGTWEITKGEGAIKGAVVEFGKESKLVVKLEIDGNKVELTGTGKVEGDKLVVKLKGPDGQEIEHTNTIKKLTADSFHFTDKDGKEVELTKKKEEKKKDKK